jgi:hypothetical protein
MLVTGDLGKNHVEGSTTHANMPQTQAVAIALNAARKAGNKSVGPAPQKKRIGVKKRK